VLAGPIGPRRARRSRQPHRHPHRRPPPAGQPRGLHATERVAGQL